MARYQRKIALAALSAALVSTNATAVTLATDGIGEVAVAPYYTTQDGWQTLISVMNVRDVPVAVRMRLREADNGRRTLDLTVALAAKDVFVGVIRDGADGRPEFINTEEQFGAVNRRTCTVPATTDASGNAVALPLQTSGFWGTDSAGDSNGNGIVSDDRLRTGHIEFIVMGYADPSTGIAGAAEVSGSPITAEAYAALSSIEARRNYIGRATEAFDCATILSAFEPANVLNTARQFGEPISALKVNVAMLNPQRGIEAGYTATTWASFYSPANGTGGPALNAQVQPDDNWNCDLHRGVERQSARSGGGAVSGTNWCPDGSSGNACNQNRPEAAAAVGGGVVESCRNLIVPHTENTALEPSLNDTFPQTADVYFEELNQTKTLAPSAAVYSTGLGGIEDVRGIDAFSLTIQRARMMNEWSVNPALGVGTDWIINQPTKNFYVDQRIGEQSAVVVDDNEAPTRGTKGRAEAFLPMTGPNTSPQGYGSAGQVPYPPYREAFGGFMVWVGSCNTVAAEERARSGAGRPPNSTGSGPFVEGADGTVEGGICLQTEVLRATAPPEDWPLQLRMRTGWLTLGLDFEGDDRDPATPDLFGAAMPTQNDGVLRGLPVIGFAMRTRNFPNRPDLSFSETAEHAYTRLLVSP